MGGIKALGRLMDYVVDAFERRAFLVFLILVFDLFVFYLCHLLYIRVRPFLFELVFGAVEEEK